MTLRAPLLTVGAGTARKAGRPHGSRNGWPTSWGVRSHYTFTPETTYELRVTFAEAQYQANQNVTIPFGVGNATASGGGQAALSVTIVNGVGNAVAAGSAFALNQSLVFTVGNAVGSGSAFALNQSTAFSVGNATAAGSVFALNEAIAGGIGNASATGSTATVTLYAARISWAEAQYQASSGTTITPTVGNAVAAGQTAVVGGDQVIACGIGNAVASGPSGASVSVDISIDCGIGNATAAGQQCQVLPPLTVAPSATPGYAPKTRYRVRVGRRWLEVDPLDPMSVRRAYDVAQEDAQDAATQNVEVPAAVAAQAVVVQPIKGPDYAGLAKEARRISEDIRKVYADALQTALIARLMREQMERDDEDDIAVLLASI